MYIKSNKGYETDRELEYVYRKFDAAFDAAFEVIDTMDRRIYDKHKPQFERLYKALDDVMYELQEDMK